MNSQVKSWLKLQHIIVPDEWLNACIEWLNNENNLSVVKPDRLKQLIYEQWLSTDIKSIPSSCLPSGLSSTQKQKINGYFCLQIESLMDIGSSAYSQLQKLKGTESLNEAVTLKERSQDTWEPKPTRMLLMKLTDGIQVLQGMEYQSIPTLNVDTLPGIKILIFGTIDCRLGMLLLTASNTKVLGGLVEDLVQENSQLKLLTKIVNDNTDINRREGGIDENSISRQHTSNYLRINSIGQDYLDRNNSSYIASSVSQSSNDLPRNSINSLQSTNNNILYNHFLSNENSFDDFIDETDDVFENLDFDEIAVLENQSTNSENTFVNDCFNKNKDKSQLIQENNQLLSNSEFPNEIITNIPFKTPLFQKNTVSKVLPILSSSNNLKETFRNESNNSKEDLAFSNVHNQLIDEWDCRVKKRRVEFTQNDVYSEPLSYLNTYGDDDIINDTIFVRAYITTILSKLECNNGNKWNLIVKINDGTKSLDVNIDNAYLEELIGFKANDVAKIKILAHQKPDIKIQLQNGLQNCQNKLLHLCGIFKIKFIPGKMPSVLNVTSESSSAFNQLLIKVTNILM